MDKETYEAIIEMQRKTLDDLLQMNHTMLDILQVYTDRNPNTEQEVVSDVINKLCKLSKQGHFETIVVSYKFQGQKTGGEFQAQAH